MEHASDTMGLWCYGGVGNSITSGIPNDSSVHCDYLLALHIVISCDGKMGVYSRQAKREGGHCHCWLQGASGSQEEGRV